MKDYESSDLYRGIFPTTGGTMPLPETPGLDSIRESVPVEIDEPSTRSVHTFAVLANVYDERQRQESKWGQQNHDDLMWSAILAEEVGESAQEVLTREWGREAGGGHGDLREELVQVAAVVVAWIEAIDRRSVDV